MFFCVIISDWYMNLPVLCPVLIPKIRRLGGVNQDFVDSK